LRKESQVEITRELVLPVPSDEVWEALTDPERLEEWFANDVEFDLGEGEGEFRWENGEVRRAVVQEADPGRRLAIRWWDPDGEGESEVVFTIDEVPEGTRLTVTESGDTLQACAGEWTWALELVSLQAMPFGFWPAITRRAASSSVVSICPHMDTHCVLASLGAVDPEARKHHLKGHSVRRSRLLCAV
jgi:uncharacterized protein YndB with AHSA1/START domain